MKKDYAKSVMTSFRGRNVEHIVIKPHLSKSSFKQENKQA